jgi:poly(3-hydroxybutyrate) depolymerase
VWSIAYRVAADTNGTINVNGVDRNFVYAVSAYPAPATGRPLVIYLHGDGGNMGLSAAWKQAVLNDANGAVLLSAQGRNNIPAAAAIDASAWRLRMDEMGQPYDDVDFIFALRVTATADDKLLGTKIDWNQVYVVGESRGAVFAYFLYADPRTSREIRAIVPISGSFGCEGGVLPEGVPGTPALPGSDLTCGEVSPFGYWGAKPALFGPIAGRPAHILDIHGELWSGEDPNTAPPVLNTDFAVTAWGGWAKAAGCYEVQVSDQTEQTLAQPIGGKTVKTYAFSQAAGNLATRCANLDLTFYSVQGGGHVPPGFEATAWCFLSTLGGTPSTSACQLPPPGAFRIYLPYVTGGSADIVLPGLSVSGINIVANGQPVRLRGINMGDPFWARNPDWYPNYSTADYQKISQDWHANVVRISIFPTQWKNMDHTALLTGLAREVNSALNSKMYVIIAYHVIGWPDGWAAPGNPADTYDSSMDLATSFWTQMAQTYGSDNRIIFDLWNEPVHDGADWAVLDPNPYWPILRGYYETLIQTVRNNGAQNIVLATGNRWASWLVSIKDTPLTDPNVVYAYHKYSVPGGPNTVAEWNKDTGGLIGVKPVIVSEWGYEDSDVAGPTWPGSRASYGDPFTQWMDSNQLSNLAWMYHHDWTPALLKGDGTLTLYGTFVKQYLNSNPYSLVLPIILWVDLKK